MVFDSCAKEHPLPDSLSQGHKGEDVGAQDSSHNVPVSPGAGSEEGPLFKRGSGGIRMRNGEFVRQEVPRFGAPNEAVDSPVADRVRRPSAKHQSPLAVMEQEDPFVMCRLCGPVMHKNESESHRRGKKHERVLERCKKAEGNGESRVMCYVCIKPFGTPNALRHHQLESSKHKELYFNLGVANPGVPPGAKQKRDERTVSPEGQLDEGGREGASNSGRRQQEGGSLWGETASQDAPADKGRKRQCGRGDWQGEREAEEFERKRQKRAERFGAHVIGGREAPAPDGGFSSSPSAESSKAKRSEWEQLMEGHGGSGVSGKASAWQGKAGLDEKELLSSSRKMPPALDFNQIVQGQSLAENGRASAMRGQSLVRDAQVPLSVRLPVVTGREDPFCRRSENARRWTESARRRSPRTETLRPAGFGTDPSQGGTASAGSGFAPLGVGGVSPLRRSSESAAERISGSEASEAARFVAPPRSLPVGERGVAVPAKAPAGFWGLERIEKPEAPQKWLWEGGTEQEADGRKARLKGGLKMRALRKEAVFGGRGKGGADGTFSHGAEREIPEEGEWRLGRAGDTMAAAAMGGKPPDLIGLASERSELGWWEREVGDANGLEEGPSLRPWLLAEGRASVSAAGGVVKTEAAEEEPPGVQLATRKLWAQTVPTNGGAAFGGDDPATRGCDNRTRFPLGTPSPKTGRGKTPAAEAPLLPKLVWHEPDVSHASLNVSPSLPFEESTPQLVLFPLESPHSAQPPKPPACSFDLNQPPPETELRFEVEPPREPPPLSRPPGF